MAPLFGLAPAARAVEPELTLKARSARKTPTLLSMNPNTMRQLKNPSREDDRFFIYMCDYFSTCVCEFSLLPLVVKTFTARYGGYTVRGPNVTPIILTIL